MSCPDRRHFLLGLACFLFSGCAVKGREAEKPDPDGDFHAWLRKKKRYRDFSTLDEAKKAYEDEMTRKDKEAEWKAYRRKHKLR